MNKYILSLFILFLSTYANCAIEIEVIIANHSDLPKFNKKELINIFDHSSRSIKEAYKKEIVFRIISETTLANLYINEKLRVGTYAPKREWYFGIYDDSLKRFEKNIHNNTKKYGSLEALNLLIGGDKKYSSYKDISSFLSKMFKERLELIKNIKGVNNRNLINNKNWELFSFRHWFDYINSKDYTNKKVMYFSNSIILDNDLFYAPPHTLIRGGITNGFSLNASKSVFIAYAPILHKTQIFDQLRDGILTRKECIEAVSYIIAHEIGTHLLLNYSDTYDHEKCLSVPPKGLKYKKYISGFKNGFECKKNHKRDIDFEPSKNRLIVEVTSANKKVDSLLAESLGKLKIEDDRRSMARLSDIIGWCYFYNKNQTEAFKYFHKAVLNDKKYELNYISTFGLKDKNELPWNH